MPKPSYPRPTCSRQQHASDHNVFSAALSPQYQSVGGQNWTHNILALRQRQRALESSMLLAAIAPSNSTLGSNVPSAHRVSKRSPHALGTMPTPASFRKQCVLDSSAFPAMLCPWQQRALGNIVLQATACPRRQCAFGNMAWTPKPQKAIGSIPTATCPWQQHALGSSALSATVLSAAARPQRQKSQQTTCFRQQCSWQQHALSNTCSRQQRASDKNVPLTSLRTGLYARPKA